MAHREEQPLSPGMTIGILGGGQLGRMLALAAAELGLNCHIYCPDAKSPAFAVSAARTIAPYEDEGALAAFAAAVDVVTYEFENVPVATVRFLAERVAVYPRQRSLEVAQDRYDEKRLMGELGIAVAPYAPVNVVQDIYSALARTGRPAILKTRRMGYDGKGQAAIRSGDDLVAAWRSIGEMPAILEAHVPFEREVSVILARGRDGAMRAYDISENRHENGILAETSVPATITPQTAAEAVAMAEKIADAVDHVGVLAVEMFLAPGGVLMVNEIAPRVHNSGHWTQDGCLVSQFEQHIRAIAGWPLGDTARHSDVTMENLLGDDAGRWAEILAEPGARLHLYGKAEARPGRKMGHVNRIRPAGKR
ncbi:MAG TPA: 5-(carboxyamino)imidazole ribonucleotide synthase [Bauldia sp.]|nr:5-(carboxyamino)imidazole ribonucleotide synthase [Bauldia sp.]